MCEFEENIIHGNLEENRCLVKEKIVESILLPSY